MDLPDAADPRHFGEANARLIAVGELNTASFKRGSDFSVPFTSRPVPSWPVSATSAEQSLVPNDAMNAFARSDCGSTPVTHAQL